MSSQCQVISHLIVMTYLFDLPQMHQIHHNIHFTVGNTTFNEIFKSRS